MKKSLLVVSAALVITATVAAVAMYSLMGKPLHEPGMVRAETNLRGPLVPPAQPAGATRWLVELDTHLYFEARGTGRPVLIVHGGPGFPATEPWAGLESLEGDYTFYYYHQRGCGLSTRPFDRFASHNYYANMTELERTLGIGAQVADMERIRQILGQEKLIVIGHSFGGFLASMYAAEFPDRVEALILVAPADVLVLPDEGGGGDFFARLRSRLPAGKRSEFDRFLDEELLDFGGVFSRSEAELAAIHRRSGAYALEAMGETPVDAAGPGEPANGGWMAQAVYFSMGRRHDYRSALAGVPAPVLILQGQDDELSLAGSQKYAGSFPNATLHIVPRKGPSRSGHFVFDDQPEAFAARMAEFLAGRH